MVSRLKGGLGSFLKGVTEDFIVGVWNGMGAGPPKPKRSIRGKKKKKKKV